MKNKRIILLIIVSIWLLTIFVFSNQNGKNSLKLSDSFTSKIVNLYDKILKKDYTQEEKSEIIKSLRFVVRKTAHFTAYLILGLLISKLLKYYNVKHIIIISILSCLLFASLDEIHQYFIKERTSKVLDVIIDTSGSITGITLNYIIEKKKKIK